ncbi:MAG TPA: isoprenylcysteine carboxylmethyltransferase family protein [Drouetiella sp.]
MAINVPTIVALSLLGIGALVSAPVLFKGFTRRGTGVKYEVNFMIQRAPQLMSLANIGIISVGFLTYMGVLPASLSPWLALGSGTEPTGGVAIMSWLGCVILLSGLLFMIGGWYSLGEMFSTDAEVMDNHHVRDTGLLSLVMHPAYSGIIQSLLGSSLAATCVPAALFTLFVVAPLWLRRAKYEEAMLIENLGQPYKDYAEKMKWRRLVPRFFPIGV